MKHLLLFFTICLTLLMSPGGNRLAYSQEAPAKPDPRFGIVEGFWEPQEAAELNAGWERILFYWRELQPTGPDDWNTLHVLEEWLVDANSQGRTVVGLIKNTAPWASEDGTEAGVPKGLYLPADDPDNLWANYVRLLAEYYSVRNVHHWIIWNEPEIEEDVFGHEFAGSIADYYQLLKVAYKVIKQVDPQAVIHLAGLTWWHDQTYLSRLLEEAAADPEGPENDYFFDVISLHIYFRPESVRPIMNAIKDVQQKYDIDKPIWINETNAPPNRDPRWRIDRDEFEVDLEQQAWFIIQTYALGFASGAERIAVYKLIDIHLPPGGESYGLLRPDLSRRPAFDAYKVVTQYLRGFVRAKLETRIAYYVASFEHPERITRVLWARTPSSQKVKIPANGERAVLVNASGETDIIKAKDGQFELTLDGARCNDECLMGGPPIILVEEIVKEYTFEEARIPQDAGIVLPSEVTPNNVIPTSDQATPVPTNSNATAVAVAPSITESMVTKISVAPLETPNVDEMISADVTSDIINAVDPADSVGTNIEKTSPENLADTIGIWFIMAGLVVATGLIYRVRRIKKSGKARFHR